MQNLFILKVKGTARIPDYVQIRDENMSLRAYFRADRPERALHKAGLEAHAAYLLSVINDLPFGKMHKLSIEI